MKKGGEDEEKKEEPRREAVVEAPPEPPAPVAEAPATTLEARVEALEEGQVQPRTGGA
jgi:hypothetical protein